MNFFTDVVSYPFRGRGKYLLLIGAVISIIADLVSLAPLFGLLANILLFGYFCAIYFQIIETTTVGGKEAPDYPELSDVWGDIIRPMLHVLLVLFVSFGPLAIYAYMMRNHAELRVVSFSLIAFGILYAPMAMLAVVTLGTIGGLSPHIVIPAIFRSGWLYLAAVGLLLVIYVLQGITESALHGMFFVRYIVLAIVGMYCMMANGRALGLIYRERSEELNWL